MVLSRRNDSAGKKRGSGVANGPRDNWQMVRQITF